MVPHVTARKTHQRLSKFSLVTPKRLFQHYRSQADMPRRPAHVGFTPENGLKSDIAPCPKSATSGKAAAIISTIRYPHRSLTRTLRGQVKAAAGLSSATAFQKGGHDTQPTGQCRRIG